MKTNALTADQAFVAKMQAVVEKHLHDDRFGAEALSREIGLSRSQIHRKLSALKQQSVSRFIRTMRLRRAFIG